MTYDFAASVEFPEEALEWRVIWNCLETGTCFKCRILATYPFQGIGELPTTLVHPEYGPVWDMVNGIPLTHPKCRCLPNAYVRFRFELISEFPKLSELLKEGTIEEGWIEVPNIKEVTRDVETLRVETAHATGTLHEMEYLLYRTESILRRMGLSKGVAEAMAQIQRMTLLVRMLHSTFILLQSATPFGQILGVLTLMGGMATASSLGGGVGGGGTAVQELT
jgi:hypothetical protein